jgi:hypothetical protein
LHCEHLKVTLNHVHARSQPPPPPDYPTPKKNKTPRTTVGCASAERTLSQFGKGVDVQGAINSAHATVEGLKNKQPVIPAPLSVVQGANYVRPAMAVSNEPVFVAPLAVEGPRFRLPTLPTLPARVPAPAPVPFVSPVMQGAIYASGPALPSYAPLVVPVRACFWC